MSDDWLRDAMASRSPEEHPASEQQPVAPDVHPGIHRVASIDPGEAWLRAVLTSNRYGERTMSNRSNPGNYADQLVQALADVPNLPTAWLAVNAAYVNLAATRTAKPNAVARAKGKLQRDVLTRAAKGQRLDVLDPTEVLAAELEDHRAEIVNEAVAVARASGRVSDILAVRDKHERDLIVAIQSRHYVVAGRLHKLIRKTDPEVEGGHVAVEANELAGQMLRLHQAVLTVEDMGSPGGLGYYLTLVTDRTVADARILGEQPGSTQFGIIGTEPYVINVLRQVDMSVIWCPTKAEAMARAEEIEQQAARDRAARVDVAGYVTLAAAQRAETARADAAAAARLS